MQTDPCCPVSIRGEKIRPFTVASSLKRRDVGGVEQTALAHGLRSHDGSPTRLGGISQFWLGVRFVRIRRLLYSLATITSQLSSQVR
jgi:hypothetical protein